MAPGVVWRMGMGKKQQQLVRGYPKVANPWHPN